MLHSRFLLPVIALFAAAWILSGIVASTDSAGSNSIGEAATAERGIPEPALKGSGPRLRGSPASDGTGAELRGAPTSAVHAEESHDTPAKVSFKGNVSDHEGRPIGGAHVAMYGETGFPRFRANSDGSFNQSVPAGTYDISIRTKDGQHLRQRIRIDGSSNKGITFSLNDTGSIVLAVVSKHEPIAGLKFSATLRSTLPNLSQVVVGTAVTDSKGIARFDSLLSGKYRVTGTSSTGTTIRIPDIDLPSGAEHSALVRLPMTIPFTGSVRERGTTSPIAHAWLRLDIAPNGRGGTLSMEFQSSRDGTFDVDVPQGHPVRFEVNHGEYAPYPSQKQVRAVLTHVLSPLARGKTVHLDVELVPGTFLTGLVLDANGEPVSDVQLAVKGGGFPMTASSENLQVDRTATSDWRGRFDVPHLAAGGYAVDIMTKGVFHKSMEGAPFTIEPGVEKLHHVVHVQTSRSIRGFVVSSTGKPAPAARVWAIPENPVEVTFIDDDPLPVVVKPFAETYTSADGSFVLAGLPNSQTIFVRASLGTREALPKEIRDASSGNDDNSQIEEELLEEHFNLDDVVQWIEFHPQPNTPTVRLILMPTGTVSGTVADGETLKPVTKAEVVITPFDPRRGRMPRVVEVSANGTFQVHGLIPGQWEVTPWARTKYAVQEGTRLDVGATSHQLKLEFTPSLSFEGIVLSQEGRALPHARIRVYRISKGRRTHNWSAPCDARGLFQVTGAHGGDSYQLVATCDGYRSSTQSGLQHSQRNMRLQLAKR